MSKVAGAVWIVMLMMFGGLLTFIAPVISGLVVDQYDASHPVWVSDTVRVSEREGDRLVLYVSGRKLRDCRLVRAWAQVEYERRAPTDARVMRENGEVGFRRRPLGEQSLGDLVIVPVPADAQAAVISVEHECGDRLVPGVLARWEAK